jgi:7,8-dihydroneopterin aldolase/epimerase/oxygenase
MDWIRVDSFELDCIFGIWPEERLREQKVRLELSLGVDTREAAHSGRVSHTVRYDVVVEQLAEMLRFRRYLLIEVATEELCAMIFAAHALVKQVRLRIHKPQALAGKAASASVEVFRERADFATESSVASWGTSTTYLTTRSSRLSLAKVTTSQAIEDLALSNRRALLLLTKGVVQGPHGRVEPGQGQLPTRPSERRFVVSSGSELFQCEELAQPEEGVR